MAISFLVQSKKNPAPIYIRLREGRDIDAKCKTGKTVNPANFKNGAIKPDRIPTKGDAETKQKIRHYNKELDKLDEGLRAIKNTITNAVNYLKDYEDINSQWLKDILNPKTKNTAPTDLVSYFDYYFKVKKTSLKPNTIKKLKVFQNRVRNYEKDNEKVFIQNVNKEFKHKMEDWCDMREYAHNTKAKTLKVISTVCNHARERGMKTHPELPDITKGLKFQKTEHIHLDFVELEQIANVELENDRLDVARDWLIISCYTAQRVSDFLRFDKGMITEMEGDRFLDIRQEKTSAPVYVPLNQNVTDILDKRGGDFPPVFSQNPDSNKTIYNTLIKEVCRLAGIDKTVSANMKNKETNRYEMVEVPKYKAVSTHIGRRSYATNYYGIVDTALLISATGHASEVQFLRYVGKKPKTNALALAKAMRKIARQNGKEPQMEVIKNVANQ